MLTTRSACLIGLLLLAPALGQAQRREFRYGEGVTLTGRLVYKTFHGPPNFGESPKSGSRETQPILILDSKVLVTARGNTEGDNRPDELVREITLVAETRGEPEPEYTNAFNRLIKRFAYKRVVIEGALFHAETGHHHTKVLVEVYTIKRARRK